jgi:hypothetical protein
LAPKNLPNSGGRSVSIVHLRTKSHRVCFCFSSFFDQLKLPVKEYDFVTYSSSSEDLGLKNVIYNVSITETSLESCVYHFHFTQYQNPSVPLTFSHGCKTITTAKGSPYNKELNSNQEL